jgi:beta-lactamase regulating signal transducer with metallopeptidase domain
MSMTLSWLLADPGLVASGWTLLAILWQTTMVALLLAVWRGLFGRAPAQVHHTATVVAFLLVVALAVATPTLLRAMPALGSPSPEPSRGTAMAASALPPRPAVGPQGSPARTHNSLDWDGVAAAVTAGWILGVLILTARLVLAMATVADVRRRAVRITSGNLHGLAHRACVEQGVTRSIEVLASSEIEAPAVVGWWKPALIIPIGRMSQLSDDVVAGLFAHELAHVRRRDYLVNLLQSIIETLLWFSPAVRWIGRCMRETREYCCDDEAIVHGADPRAYVRALATLASGDALARGQSAMSATGPRLVQRARRLLAIEPPRRIAAGTTLCIAALVALSVTGGDVLRASSARVSRLDAIRTPLGVFPYPPVPYSYSSEQFDGALEMSSFVSTLEQPVQRVKVRNAAGQRIVGLRFVAAVEQMSSRRRLVLVTPLVRLFVSDVQSVSIAPGAAEDVSPEVMTGDALQAIVAGAAGAHVQFQVAVAAVRYEDGQELRLTLNPMAVRARDALGLDPGTIARALAQIGGLANRWQGNLASILQPRQDGPTIPRALVDTASAAGGICRDERGRTYSPGAHVRVRDEPGHSVRCDSGRWIETSPR